MINKNKIYIMPTNDNPKYEYWQVSEQNFNLDIINLTLRPKYDFIGNEPIKALSYLLKHPNVWIQFGDYWSYKLISSLTNNE